MNIIILGKAWNSGKILDIAQAFQQEGLPVTGIVAMTRPKPRRHFKTLIQSWHHEGSAIIRRKWFPGARRHSKATDAPNGTPLPSPEARRPDLASFCRQHGIRLEQVDDLNGSRAETLLKEMHPDLLVLGGTPIIRAHILAIPHHGTVNVHMGLLPQYRGRSVAEWAIFEDTPVGLTVHLVDPGVDTGAILKQQVVDVSDCKSLEQMRQKLRYLQHRFLAACAREYLQGHLQPLPQQKQAGKQYYEMHSRLKALVEAKLARGYTPKRSSTPKPTPQPSEC